MSISRNLLKILAVGALVLPMHAASQSRGEMTFYSQIGFGGQTYTVTGPRENVRIPFTVRSARLARGETWEVCTDNSYRGRCNLVNEDQGNVAWIVGSVRPAAGTLPTPQPGYSELTLYSQIGFRGQSYTVTGPRTSIRIPFTARSARMTGGGTWEICTSTDYRGRCNTVSEDQGNVAWVVGSARPAGGATPLPPANQSSLRGMASAYFPQPSDFRGRVLACNRSNATGACASQTADRFCVSQGWTTSKHELMETVGGRVYLADVLCTRAR